MMRKTFSVFCVASLLCLAGCSSSPELAQAAKESRVKKANEVAARNYASVDNAIAKNEELAEKELVVCTREKPLGTLISQTVCRTVDRANREGEATRDVFGRAQLRVATLEKM